MTDGELHLEDFRAIPVSEAADNATWILFHPEVGAYVLDASMRTPEGKRQAGLMRPGTKPSWRSAVDARLHFEIRMPHPEIKVELPADAPAGGPALFDVALQAFAAGYEPSPLRLRPGRCRADLERLMWATTILATRIRRRYVFNNLRCMWNPDLPIEPPEERTGAIDESAVQRDLGNWFGAWSRQGKEGSFDRDAPDGRQFAWLSIPEPPEAPSAHEIIAAEAMLIAFYDRAAADLGLGPQDVEARLATLGCTGKA